MRISIENHRNLAQRQKHVKNLYDVYLAQQTRQSWKNFVNANQALTEYIRNKIRQNPWILHWIESNKENAARKIQKRFLNRRALAVFSAIRTLPPNTQRKIATQVLRRRSGV